MRRSSISFLSHLLPSITLALFALSSSAQAEQQDQEAAPGTNTPAQGAKAAQLQKMKILDEMIPFVGTTTELPREVQLVKSGEAIYAEKFTSNLPIGPRGAKIPVQTVQVDAGRVDAVLAASSLNRGVLLQAPDKILGVTTSGRMAMSVTEETITIAALKGDVLVGHDGKFKPLPQGLLRVFSRKTGQSLDLPRVTPVALSPGGGLPLALSGGATVELKADSTDRELLVALLDENGAPVGPVQRIAPRAPLEIEAPRAGVYYAVARTVDKTGIYSQLSEPLRVQVLGLAEGQKPPEDGVYLLDRGERLRLEGSEGLEMRYGTSSTFVPAPASLGLYQNRLTEVEFRLAGDATSAVRLRIAPNILKTKTELGPARATWPGQPVHMRVSMWNGAGNLITDADKLAMEVTVNSRTVPVAWRLAPEEGLRAELEELQGPGPWVVRLQVSDAQGHTVARDVLDVTTK